MQPLTVMTIGTREMRRVYAAHLDENGNRVFCVAQWTEDGTMIPGLFTLPEIEELDKRARLAQATAAGE